MSGHWPCPPGMAWHIGWYLHCAHPYLCSCLSAVESVQFCYQGAPSVGTPVHGWAALTIKPSGTRSQLPRSCWTLLFRNSRPTILQILQERVSGLRCFSFRFTFFPCTIYMQNERKKRGKRKVSMIWVDTHITVWIGYHPRSFFDCLCRIYLCWSGCRTRQIRLIDPNSLQRRGNR
jgi:hypothetical protein